MTRRRYLTDAEKSAMLARQGHRCVECGVSLTACNVQFDHSVAVALGNDGKPDRAICKRPCHAEKTRVDVTRIAKAKRLHRSWFGETKPRKRTIASRGFDRTRTRKFDGTVIPRRPSKSFAGACMPARGGLSGPLSADVKPPCRLA